jgi:pSer/pThr/pTyr-binding forkhead associated (FHA) protein
MRMQLVSLDDGSVHTLLKDLTVVGRGEECDLQLNHKSVSKLHCVLVRTDGLLLLRDLGSTNGTRVNGERVRRAALLPNDKLNVANLRFKIHLGPGDDAPPVLVDAEAFTQNISIEEVREMIKRGGPNDDDEDCDLGEPDMSVRQNALPDRYVEPPSAGGKPKR